MPHRPEAAASASKGARVHALATEAAQLAGCAVQARLSSRPATISDLSLGVPRRLTRKFSCHRDFGQRLRHSVHLGGIHVRKNVPQIRPRSERCRKCAAGVLLGKLVSVVL